MRKYDSVKDIASNEGIASPSYASRILRLPLLAPDIQEAILNSTRPATLDTGEASGRTQKVLPLFIFGDSYLNSELR